MVPAATQFTYKSMLRTSKLEVRDFFRRAESTLLSLPGSRRLWRLLSSEFNPRDSILPVECDVFD